jgi:hypothetical protein
MVAAVLFLVLATFVLTDNGSVRQASHDLPDAALTPGDIFPGVTDEQICVPGYARSVRNVPEAISRLVFIEYNLAGKHSGYCDSQQGCELDHLISLSLGGSNEPKNLWPQTYDGSRWNAHVKDRLEDRLHALVCSHQMPLAVAQRALANDWISSFVLYVGPSP